MVITANFKLEEFACHDKKRTAYPEEWIPGRLKLLCARLEILRAELGGARITILSGYRTPAYNASIGGAQFSQHVKGRAADIVVDGVTPADVHATVLRLIEAGRLQFRGLGSYDTFTHVDIREGDHLAQWIGPARDA